MAPMVRSQRRIRARSLGRIALLAGALSAIDGAAIAQGTPAAPIALPAGAGQQALAVQIGAGGVLARVCAGPPCTADGGKALEVPADVRPLLAAARARAIPLADGKQLARVEARRGADGSWVMLIAAPLAGKGSDPLVLWSGWTDLASGEHGEERSGAVLEEPAGKGSRVLVGQRREDVTMCGREAIVAAREVDPATMTLARGASAQNLPAEERARAPKLTATRRAGDAPLATFRLLRPTLASSALGKRFSEIADGDPATAWAEAKDGVGRGEFVSFSSAGEVGITGLEIRIRPHRAAEDDAATKGGAAAPSAAVGEGVAPRTLFVATQDRLFEIAFPEDAWREAGAAYEVKLPEEVRTSCLAIVLEDAYAPRGARSPQVTIAEVTARTAFDGQSPQALVGALAGGGERAKAAGALLSRGGPAAVEAAIAGYGPLDDAGRQLAAEVIDTSPCSVQAPFFADRLAAAAIEEAKAKEARGSQAPDQPDPEAHHARDRLRRCGRAAAPALATIVRGAADPARLAAARELALVAPAEAVPPLLDALPKTGDATRRELRAALSQAAQSERAADALARELAPDRFRAHPEVAQLDLLRAVGPALARVPGAADALRRLATPGAPFRTRYLLQAPAAELARGGDARSLAYVRASLREDADAPVRARAAEAAGRVPALAPDLLAAVADREVRVREAAVVALGKVAAAGMKLPAGAAGALAGRLAKDPWTFVRAVAARALLAMPAAPAVDGALAAALGDASPEVRASALDALGAHRAVAHIEAVKDRAEDKEESLEVRARAILTLAAMCDRSSVDLWTRLAVQAKTPMGDRDHRLGTAALAALGQVHPADLEKRLAPLREKGTPRGLQEMARAAIEATGQCR